LLKKAASSLGSNFVKHLLVQKQDERLIKAATLEGSLPQEALACLFFSYFAVALRRSLL
jgi:hypothetical protein